MLDYDTTVIGDFWYERPISHKFFALSRLSVLLSIVGYAIIVTYDTFASENLTGIKIRFIDLPALPITHYDSNNLIKLNRVKK